MNKIQKRQLDMAPLVDLSQIIERKKQLDQYIREGLKEGVDFGTIKGTPKPTLLKPGAEQVMGWFNCRPTFEILSESHNGNVHRYAIRAILTNRSSDAVYGEGVGACASDERQYRNRNEPENKIIKMAKKRALVDAVLTTFALSDRFTQDQEEHVEDNSDLKKQIAERLTELCGGNADKAGDLLEAISEWRDENGAVKRPGATNLGMLSYEVKPGKRVSQAEFVLSQLLNMDPEGVERDLEEWRANRA